MLTLYASYLQMKHINDQLEPALERILKLEPDNQVALYQLVQLAVHANDYPKVADICTRAIMHYPEQLPYYFYLGFSYYQPVTVRTAAREAARRQRREIFIFVLLLCKFL